MNEHIINYNRANFPHSLCQPKGSFRYGADALALLEFAKSMKLPPAGKIADIGCGCGVLGLGILLKSTSQESASVIGLDNNLQMLDLAAENAAALSLPFSPIAADILQTAQLKEIKHTYTNGGFDLAVCNPPWRLLQNGRLPPDPGRKNALCGDIGTLPMFIAAADYLLQSKGSLLLVCGAERLPDCLCALPERMHPVRLRLVHPTPNAGAVFFLLEARKNSRAKLLVEPPLFLPQNSPPSDF